VCVHQPQIAEAEHRVGIDEVIKWAGSAFPDRRVPEKFAAIMANTSVATRTYIRAPKDVFTDGTGPDQWPVTVALLAGLGVRAARAALEAAGTAPREIDALIVTSVTGYAMPGIDVDLVRELGLRPNVRRLPIAQIGCAGGLFALIRASEQIAARPASKVLVVAAEAFSSTTQPHMSRPDALIYKALGGDGAAAAVVTEADQGADGVPHVLLDGDGALDYLIPDTADYYRLSADSEGRLGFGSNSKAPGAIRLARPALSAWFNGRDAGFVVAHHGGPKVLEHTAEVLGADQWQLRHSWASLEAIGNCGSVSFHDVLARTLDETGPEAARGEGTALAIGPGVTINAARLHRP
jgi:predicted naringenin-chalcone synthase